jgi:antitoxin YefM
MSVMPLSEVKAHLSEIGDEVVRTHDRVRITKNGRDHLVLMAVEDYESMEATIELLSDPAAQERIRQSEADIEAGDFVEAADLSALIDKRRTGR